MTMYNTPAGTSFGADFFLFEGGTDNKSGAFRKISLRYILPYTPRSAFVWTLPVVK